MAVQWLPGLTFSTQRCPLIGSAGGVLACSFPGSWTMVAASAGRDGVPQPGQAPPPWVQPQAPHPGWLGLTQGGRSPLGSESSGFHSVNAGNSATASVS